MEEEEWRPIEGYEGLYSVSNLGRVFSHKNGQCRKLQIAQKYSVVMLNKSGRRKNFRVNRLVALAFVPNPYNLPEVGHIQEPKTNNRWDNLEWTTHKDNLQYASAVGAFERRSA